MLDSKEYMQIRNALTVLIKVAPVFPAMSKVFMVIEKKVGSTVLASTSRSLNFRSLTSSPMSVKT